MVGPEVFGHLAGIARFVERLLGERDRERLDRLRLAHLRHHRHDRRGVDPSREEDSQGDIAHETPLDRAREQRLELLHDLTLRVDIGDLVGRHVPVSARSGFAVVDDQQLAGTQFVDAGEDGARRRYVFVGEVFRHRLAVDLAMHQRVREQALELGPEDEGPAAMRPVERLLAHAVARDEEAPAPPVPHRQAEHAVEARGELVAVFLIERRDDLRIGVRAETVSEPLEIALQFLEVVELAVAHGDDGTVLAGHGLFARHQIDDGKPPHGEPDRPLDEVALVVRAAMDHGRVHPREQRAIDRPTLVIVDYAADATHYSLIVLFTK